MDGLNNFPNKRHRTHIMHSDFNALKFVAKNSYKLLANRLTVINTIQGRIIMHKMLPF